MYYDVMEVKSLPNYILDVVFRNGERKLFDFKPFLQDEIFRHFSDIKEFEKVQAKYGMPYWDEDTDFSPKRIYDEGKLIENCKQITHYSKKPKF